MIRAVAEQAQVMKANAGDDPERLIAAFDTLYMRARHKAVEEDELRESVISERTHFAINARRNDNTRDAMRRARLKAKVDSGLSYVDIELNEIYSPKREQIPVPTPTPIPVETPKQTHAQMRAETVVDCTRFVSELRKKYLPYMIVRSSDVVHLALSFSLSNEPDQWNALLDLLIERGITKPGEFNGEYIVTSKEEGTEPNPEQGGLLTSAIVQLKKR
jgi:hypothetical protein